LNGPSLGGKAKSSIVRKNLFAKGEKEKEENRKNLVENFSRLSRRSGRLSPEVRTA